jgi:hypothetical protein
MLNFIASAGWPAAREYVARDTQGAGEAPNAQLARLGRVPEATHLGIGVDVKDILTPPCITISLIKYTSGVRMTLKSRATRTPGSIVDAGHDRQHKRDRRQECHDEQEKLVRHRHHGQSMRRPVPQKPRCRSSRSLA